MPCNAESEREEARKKREVEEKIKVEECIQKLKADLEEAAREKQAAAVNEAQELASKKIQEAQSLASGLDSAEELRLSAALRDDRLRFGPRLNAMRSNH